ncbi:putative tailspike protein [Serratia phage vB_SmaS_Rovert]|uniref:Putative tailspike protein n=1 Tax=Serratia phage vB_SmaS_Rovert TaxID=2777363 RepID=A0A7T3N9S7_9CAUD|nr:putative tailspike protein [Serratia phage vB_SmaS_Rovert]QPX74988.1 putative tailspike protein [Serratia phage vB_SmaS_Rovert]
MAILISGILKDGMSNPMAGYTVLFISKKNTSDVLNTVVGKTVTDNFGAYSINAGVGEYVVAYYREGLETKTAGCIKVLPDSVPGDINSFLTTPGESELTPEIVQAVMNYRNQAQAAAEAAIKAAKDAKLYVDSAVGLQKPYLDIDLAKADITSGAIKDKQVFSVVSPTKKNTYDLWYNNAGVATPILNTDGVQVSYPSTSALDEVLNLVKQSETATHFFEVVDDFEYIGFSISGEDGTINSMDNIILTPNKLQNKKVTIEDNRLDIGSTEITQQDSEYLIYLEDGRGYQLEVSTGANNSGTTPPPENDWQQLIQRNAENIAKANAIFRKRNTFTQPFNCKYNGVIMTSQSLGTGYEGWPAISNVWYENLNNKMLGNSTRPSSRSANEFIPLGNSSLQNLKAVTQSIDGLSILNDSQTSALAPGASNEGESPIVAAVNYLKYLYLEDKGLKSDDNMILVASDTGVAGRTIEQLINILFKRFTDAVDGQMAAAIAAGGDYCVPLIFFMQGEWNYTTAYGGTVDPTEYKAFVNTYFDMVTNYVMTKTGQEKPPAFVIYQTGAGYTNVDDLIKIGKAQFELSQEREGVVMASTVYQETDKGGHLQPNGYANVGARLGYAAFKYCIKRENFVPTHIKNYVAKGKEVLCNVIAYEYPIISKPAYNVVTPMDYLSKGFKPVDSAGINQVTSVEFVADSIIKLNLQREIVGDLWIVYAGKNDYNGNGNICDSSSVLCPYKYVYQEGRGQYPATNIPELVGKPYDMSNWLVANRIQAEVIK